MRNLIKCLTACLFVFTLSNCSHKNFIEGTYQQSKITADGDLSDWGLPLRFESNVGSMQYAVTNDNDNIYVSLHTSDDATQMKILKAGVEIYIDPSGGQNKKMDISFPLKNSNNPGDFGQQKTSSAERPDRMKLKEEMIMLSNTFNVAGFQTIENRLYDVKDSSNIRVALKLDAADNMGYEVIIPLKTILGKTITEKEAEHKMTIGITINAMPADQRQSERHDNGTFKIGGGRMRHGGNHRSAPGIENAMPDKAAQYKEDANWCMFKLAYKK